MDCHGIFMPNRTIAMKLKVFSATYPVGLENPVIYWPQAERGPCFLTTQLFNNPAPGAPKQLYGDV